MGDMAIWEGDAGSCEVQIWGDFSGNPRFSVSFLFAEVKCPDKGSLGGLTPPGSGPSLQGGPGSENLKMLVT